MLAKIAKCLEEEAILSFEVTCQKKLKSLIFKY